VTDQAIEFIKTLFGPTTEKSVYICSLANERDDPSQPSERHVSTRDGSDIQRFIAKWDRPGRGLFFCVGTINGSKRAKEHVAESIGLHADIDLKDIDYSRADVERKLATLRYPPSVVVNSGNGLHAYWLFKEALPTAGELERLEAALKQLADLVGGDMQCCEVSRLMRLPGSHNTKRSQFLPVEVLTSTTIRYELDDLEEWLAEASPVILRKVRPAATAEGTNPFLEAAKSLGFKPSVDVEKRLAGMCYMGGGDASIHATQLAVSASLLNSGADLEEVVATLLAATQSAAAGYGERWNWRREEKAIRAMCDAWVKKHPRPAVRPLEQVRAAEEMVNGGAVVNLAAKRQERAKPKKAATSDKQVVPSIVADGVIEVVRSSGQDLLLTEGEIWLYAQGIWHVMSPADQQWILTLIQQGFEALNEPGKPSNLTAAYKRLTEHPALFQRKVEWAGSDVIVCQNGVLEIATREFHPHAPHWYARRKIGTNYEPKADCPRFKHLVQDMFADRPVVEQAGYTNVIQAWMGSALAVSHLSREERKALILVGPSRTGKTELSRIIRLLIGDPIATPSVAEISERFGLASLYDAAAWIRDDAINEGDDLDPQRFKTIVTGEPIDIERKHKPAVPGVELQLPVLLTTNALPKARDKSDAIFNRALVLEMTNVVSEEAAFVARQQAGVPRGQTLGSHLMQTEGPGLLNWALEGLQRLLERGSYDMPESVRNAIQRFKDDNNPVGEWARTALTKSPHGKVSRADIACAYHGWQREQDGDDARAFGNRALIPRLRAVAPWAGDMADDSGRRYVTGVHLTPEGLQLWDLHSQGPQLKGGSKGSSLTKHEVNKLIVITPSENPNAPRF
jgi:P4 family phage/plasmid primase-like protien